VSAWWQPPDEENPDYPVAQRFALDGAPPGEEIESTGWKFNGQWNLCQPPRGVNHLAANSISPSTLVILFGLESL